ncbi:MAG: SDR family oxidoreductase [Phyllobacterium sp.]|uniref:SDR family oxidoreductase n=1 Tax=Phyllobacterium sp. TaxID=1871046 RepID=UPI0030F30F1B
MPDGRVARRSVLITGASRGLGRELTLQYAVAGWNVFACSRAGATSGGQDGAEHHVLDVADAGSIAGLAERLRGRPIDVLINNAAIRGGTGGLSKLDADDFLSVMRVNALAPLLVVRAFLPNLLAGRRRLIANISSRAGSMAEGTIGDADGDYSYRCSKAALNMATTKLAVDLKHLDIKVLSLHPGWIKTDMGGHEADTGVTESAAGIMAIIERAGSADSGSFRTFEGRAVAW